MLNWATVEAYNNSIERINATLHNVGGSEAAIFLVRALVRDVLMTLLRITDDPGKDRQTILTFRKEWENATFDLLPEDIAEHKRKLFENVPLKWTKGENPKTELWELRDKLRHVRNALIAHALDFSKIGFSHLGKDVRELLTLLAGLSNHTAAMADLDDDNLEERWKINLGDATSFWDRIA